MLNISHDGIISMYKEDNIQIPLFINIGTITKPVPYTLKNSDRILFSVTEPNSSFETGFIKKIYTKSDCDSQGKLYLRLEPKDTKDVLPGTYYYEVKLSVMTPDNKEVIDTIVNKRKFIIFE